MIAKNIKNNTIIKLDDYYLCIDFQMLNETIKLNLKNIKNNDNVIKIFNINDEITTVEPVKKDIIFKNVENNNAVFLLDDNILMLELDYCKSEIEYIKENSKCYGYFFEDILIYILPLEMVILRVEKIERKNSSWEIFNLKNIMLETGVWVRVPLVVQKGDLIKIDTKTNEFIKIEN